MRCVVEWIKEKCTRARICVTWVEFKNSNGMPLIRIVYAKKKQSFELFGLTVLRFKTTKQAWMVRVKTNVKIIKLVMIETVGDYMQVFYYGLRFFGVSASNRLGQHVMDNNRDRRFSLQWKRKRHKRMERRRRNKCFKKNKNKNKKPNFECSERLTKWNWIRVI